MKKNKGQGRRGRPLGFKLTEESKRAISESKKGQRHRQTTRDKISKSLIIHFKNRYPLSEELTNMYCRFDNDEISEWMIDNTEDLDLSDDIMTIKSLRNARRIELSCGSNIEYFSHEMTPELIVLFKEYCKEEDKDPDEYYDSL